MTEAQAREIDAARSGAGGWFVEKGCFACHSVSVYNVKSYSQMGPDLSTSAEDVKSRFNMNLDDFDLMLTMIDNLSRRKKVKA